MFNWDDLQAFCDDLSNWIVELDLVEELEKAAPAAEFPLKADPKEDDLQDGLDTLVYLTVWMCLKAQTKAPPHLESRILLCGELKGPWKLMYSRLCSRLINNELPSVPTRQASILDMIDIWNLAS